MSERIEEIRERLEAANLDGTTWGMPILTTDDLRYLLSRVERLEEALEGATEIIKDLVVADRELTDAEKEHALSITARTVQGEDGA